MITTTPAQTLSLMLIGRDIDELSSATGIEPNRIRALADTSRLHTVADQSDLQSIARAVGVQPRTMGYLAEMKAIPSAETATETGPIRFAMSTDSSDRYSDIVEQTFDLDGFKRNPVAPFNHDYSQPPIGKWENVRIEDNQLRGDLVFDPNPDHTLARVVESQYRTGFLNTVSVGFLPGATVKRNTLDDDDPRYARSGFVFSRNVLLEASAVVVPGNSEAVAISRSLSTGIERSTPEPDPQPDPQPDPWAFLSETTETPITDNLSTVDDLSWLR